MDDRVNHLLNTYTLTPKSDKRLEINDLLKMELQIEDEFLDHEYIKTYVFCFLQ